MTTMTNSSPTASHSLEDSLQLIEVKPGVKFSLATLRTLLPDVETILFFGKVYELDAAQLGALLHKVLGTDLAQALFGEGHLHSNELQDYLIGEVDEFGNWSGGVVTSAQAGEVAFAPVVPAGEILPEVWKQLEVEVASSIKDVAAKLSSVVSRLPGKQGSMVFSSMMTMNAKRPTLGDYRAKIHHDRQQENLLILDVSGSMTESTVRQIIDDVVALSYTANAHMAIVSNTCTYWEPGTYGVNEVLAACEFGGTHYEELTPLFDRDWGVVITVADYDSSPAAKQAIAPCTGRIDKVIDISLVNRPTFLAQCVGQLASEVEPILIGSGSYVLC